ncbi:unnamed protein product [Rotaria sordida]|uniref:Uncharacterized protein n=1 Tax=Rotaria sordida TaxID=392033 RepID=A0A814F814_9BILA|nr:unnamed protein product [Rotaria sordida]
MHICHAASSCSDQVHVTDTFLDKKKHRTLFNIKCYNGQIIKNHSHYPDESETILPPGICIRVKSQSIPADNLYIISCEEIILTPEEMNNLLKTGAVATASAAMPITTSVLYLLWLDPNVVNGQFGRKTVPEIHDLPQPTSIFLYCMDKKANEKWAKNYTKVKAIVTRSNELIKEIEQEKSLLMLELANANETQLTVNTPLSGYEKQPLKSLEEALKPVDHLIEDLRGHVAIAKKHCAESTDGLTRDESASLIIFGMEWGETSLYKIFNAILRSEDRHKIKP